MDRICNTVTDTDDAKRFSSRGKYDFAKGVSDANKAGPSLYSSLE